MIKATGGKDKKSAASLGYALLTQPTKTCYPTAFGCFRHRFAGRVSKA